MIPELDLTTVRGGIEALSSPAVNTRYLGFNQLKNGGNVALAAIEKLMQHENKFIAARGIWLLPHLGPKGKEACVRLLSDPEPLRRITAYRALRRVGTEMIPHAKVLASDSDPGVRRDVALSLRDLPAALTKEIFVTLAQKVELDDKNAVEAIGLGAANQENEIWAAIKAAMNPASPTDWNDRLARLTWRLWPSAAVADLQARASDASLTQEQRDFAIESLAFINDKSAADAIVTLTENPLAKKQATYWLFQNAMGEWSGYDLYAELKKRGIYDPDQITVTEIKVPKGKDPKFSVKEVLALKGDAAKGKTTAMRCVMCHEFHGTGVNYGPNLKGWGKGQSAEVIARAIIEPSADIAHGYDGTNLMLKDGRRIDGLVFGWTDPTSITSTGGVTQLVPKKLIKKYQPRRGSSLMLSADQLGLTAQEVADLVEFLKTY